MIRLFRREKNNILKNLEIYEQKEKIKQQESKIYGQKPVKCEERNKKNTNK